MKELPKLPNKQQRNEIIEKKQKEDEAWQAKMRANEEEKRKQADEARRERVIDLIKQVPGGIGYAVGKQNFYFLRIKEENVASEETKLTATAVIHALREIAPDDYNFSFEIEDYSYEAARQTADGGLGDSFTVHTKFQAVKISWPE